MVLWINACVRGESSRTMDIAKHLANALHDEVTELVIDREDIKPLDAQGLRYRESCLMRGDTDDNIFRYAKQFAEADTIIISAPYWDLSFPSLLKVYLENICVVGVTFVYNEKGEPVTLCRAKKLYYVTTAGGPIYSDEFGYGYVKKLAETFFGVKEVIQYKAEMLDVFTDRTDETVSKMKAMIDKDMN